MKRFLLTTLVLATCISNNAFATHAYRGEKCKSATHNLNYEGNYPVGGMYSMTLIGHEEEPTPTLPLIDVSETNNTLQDADVLFTERSSRLIADGPSSNDCGFDHKEWTSKKVIEINLISHEASKRLGLKQGDKITFICEESTDYPNGSECN